MNACTGADLLSVTAQTAVQMHPKSDLCLRDIVSLCALQPQQSTKDRVVPSTVAHLSQSARHTWIQGVAVQHPLMADMRYYSSCRAPHWNSADSRLQPTPEALQMHPPRAPQHTRPPNQSRVRNLSTDQRGREPHSHWADRYMWGTCVKAKAHETASSQGKEERSRVEDTPRARQTEIRCTRVLEESL
ncbi:hypothetical protein NDU88_000695 [Pleurodeles waltl]|uniref:Uncharacterized protein n=1 Tax=Pleurodeles waltl TaxID=8319 RepID=A0AAV7U5Z1_PLEWA|nr:hypothetical protein NDU88_000695 [Pleurodeles waltl]